MGKNLKIKRIEKGYMQKDLADMVGISNQYLNALENGRAKNPSMEVMKKLADALGTSIPELFFN